MKITRYAKPLGPGLATEWGNYAPVNVAYEPAAYRYQQPAVPWLMQGQTPVAPPGLLGSYLGDNGAALPGVALPAASGSMLPATSQNLAGKIVLSGLGLLLLLGAAGLVGYLIASAYRSPRRNPETTDVAAAPAAATSIARNPANRKLSSYAKSRRRDRHGRFIRAGR